MTVFSDIIEDGKMQHFHAMEHFTAFYSLCDALSYILK